MGTYGFSYDGATQLQAAPKRPPSLRTICPGFTGSQYYEGWAYNGGAFAVRLQVSSSDFPQWDRNLNTGGPLSLESITQARVAT